MSKRENIQRTEERQAALLARMRAVPEQGEWVTHLGEKFIVYRDVLPPWDDSKPLIEKFEVPPAAEVLDVGTGTGVIAIFAVYKGAARVVATDINPAALRNCEYNAIYHGFSSQIEVRYSDVFSHIAEDEVFDIITANLPFREKRATDLAAASMWDTNFETTKRFLAGARNHLKPGGKIYLAQASFGETNQMKALASISGYSQTLIGERTMPGEPGRVYYVFELTPR